jgi:D-3-phosphoglycerate dehydrogenase
MKKIPFSREKVKVLLLEGLHKKAIDIFISEGYKNIEYIENALEEEVLLEKIKDVHFIGIRSRTCISKKIIDNAPKLLGIGCFCIGTNRIDLKYANEKGIVVFNAPFSNTRSVAEITIAASIMLMRGLPEKNIRAHKGEWLKSAKNSNEIRRKKLGLIGYGNIGSQVSNLASGLGMHVYYYDIEEKLPHGNATACNSIDEILEISDIISLHIPENEITKNIINKNTIDKMKDGACFINYARGNLVDIPEFCKALDSGKIRSAAFDVFPEEPSSNKYTFFSPLREYDNVMISPHIGGSTEEAQENIGTEVAYKMLKYCQNGTTSSSVNFPNVNLPKQNNSHRILHIHKNVSGVLAKINNIFVKNNINILGEFLQTNQETGYVVIDIEETPDLIKIYDELNDINETIKVRILWNNL